MSNDPFRIPGQEVAAKPATRGVTDGQAIPGAKTMERPRRDKDVAPTAPKDAKREIVETIVFVVVLVLLLKAFVAEAFVIPTGSMATTLLGYQKWAECPKCHFSFPVNCSDQEERKPPKFILGGTCPNCRYDIDFDNKDVPPCSTGDRVLVAKYLYDSGLADPTRLNVVVFKYPEEPQKEFVAQNYIKRLIGLPGETIAIRYGKLYVLKGNHGLSHDDRAVGALDLWKKPNMHEDDPQSLALLQQKDSPFEIIRKPPDKILSLRRIVYDNDHQASDLAEELPPRWAAADAVSSWTADGPLGFQQTGSAADQTDWLRYRHILRRGGPKPELITDFLGYNTKHESLRTRTELPCNWVGDLMLECEVTLEKPAGELVLELSKGTDRFRARWSIAEGGMCTLSRVTGDKESELDRQATPLKKPGTYRLRFANVDDRLVVWVDSDLPFGDGRNYEPAAERGPTLNDLQPASIGVRKGAALKVSHVRLWRDTYYTIEPNVWPGRGDVASAVPPEDLTGEQRQNWDEAKRKLEQLDGWGDPAMWGPLHNLPSKTLYVQPGHYLCMGDNSPESSDGRSWGLVPSRLLLGRALLVYWPPTRAGTIK